MSQEFQKRPKLTKLFRKKHKKKKKRYKEYDSGLSVLQGNTRENEREIINATWPHKYPYH